MSGAIFISYRRDDSEGEAGRLYDDLVRVFGPDAVFMDVTDIHPGKDFRQAIDDNVSKCAVLLAVIGPGWTTIKDAAGNRRLDEPNDFVRLEIASALARNVDVIPVLVHGARMPNPAELPANLQNLAYRNCVEVTHTRWNSDVEVLSRTLREYVQRRTDFPTRSIHMAITGESAARTEIVPDTEVEGSHREAIPAKPRGRLGRAAAYFLVIVAAAATGAGGYVFIHHQLKHHDREKDNSASSQGPAEQAPASAPADAIGASSSPAGPAGAASPPAWQTTSSPAAPVERVSTTGAANQALFQPLLGTWTNAQAQNGKPMRVQISAAGESVSLHIWTRCGPSVCDLGSRVVPLSGDGITTQWAGRFSNAGNEQVVLQTVSMRIYRLGPGLHMIFYGTQTGSTGFDFVRSQ